MTNEDLFKALSSPMRLKILKKISDKEMHISGLARELAISVPVTAKHVKILENVGLINKKIFGNTHILSIKTTNLEKMFEPFIKESSIKINKQKSLFEALNQIPGIEIKKFGKHQYIKSIDNDDGYYIYEVDGKLPKEPIDEYKIDKNITLDLKKITTVNKKKIRVKIKK